MCLITATNSNGSNVLGIMLILKNSFIIKGSLISICQSKSNYTTKCLFGSYNYNQIQTMN